jgi:hypothetical protein
MKTIIAGILTLAILAAMLFVGSRRIAPTPSADPDGAGSRVEAGESPAEEAVRRLIRSGDQGDVTGYLDSFSESMRARLARDVESRGREAFAEDLRRASGARKAHAVFAAEPDGDDAARVTVETVYPDRNERQTYRVVKSGDGWRVAEVATARTRQPSARFGTPAGPSSTDAAGPEVSRSPKVGLTVEAGDDPDSP